MSSWLLVVRHSPFAIPMQLVIQLPSREEQIAFNRTRWKEICDSPDLARFPGKVESNAFGQALMMPPASGSHSRLQGRILLELHRQLGGIALPECPVSTIDGVRAADVGWYSEARFAQVDGQIAFEIAPEICVEVLSPRNTDAEMAAKRALYFEAGAREVWLCAADGTLSFYLKNHPDTPSPHSAHCASFPGIV